jgi:hypothetical protein
VRGLNRLYSLYQHTVHGAIIRNRQQYSPMMDSALYNTSLVASGWLHHQLCQDEDVHVDTLHKHTPDMWPTCVHRHPVTRCDTHAQYRL